MAKTAERTPVVETGVQKKRKRRVVRALITAFSSVFVLVLAVVLFLGMPDMPWDKIEKFETSTNSYIRDYLDMDISAHRSGAGVAPENTLMAFRQVLERNEEYGVDTYEFDVNITADGELVILHNLTYDKTSDAVEYFGRENVAASEITLAEAKKLNMGENFELDGEYPYRGLRGDDIPADLRVVTCDEAFDFIEANSNGKKFNYIIEIKSTEENGKRAADKLYSIITERNLQDRVIWATSEIPVSEYMAANYPDMPRSANPNEVIEFFVCSKLGIDLSKRDVSYMALHIPYGEKSGPAFINLGTKRLINYAHKYNIAVQYWTINSEKDVRKLAENGADCVMTDYPDMAYKVVNSMK